MWCHLVSDVSIDELHFFALYLGLKRAWFQGDHYDLKPLLRELAIELGASQVSSKELIIRMVPPRRRRVRLTQ